ncbi:MAG: alpha/beta hydrolase-fold protein, partial [Candidatus Neomarinimicrobiota bacterium]
RRIYLTGLSMGGYGTWSLALAQPERFAAIAPICGGGDRRQACRLKDLPVWAFHGARDKVVPVRRTKRMVRAIEKCGGSPRLTIYLDAGHDSWTRTYDNPELYEWLLSNVREEGNGQ